MPSKVRPIPSSFAGTPLQELIATLPGTLKVVSRGDQPPHFDIQGGGALGRTAGAKKSSQEATQALNLIRLAIAGGEKRSAGAVLACRGFVHPTCYAEFSRFDRNYSVHRRPSRLV